MSFSGILSYFSDVLDEVEKGVSETTAFANTMASAAAGEPVIDFGEHRARVIETMHVAQGPGEAYRYSKLPQSSLLPLRDGNGFTKISLGCQWVQGVRPGCDFATDSIQFGVKEVPAGLIFEPARLERRWRIDCRKIRHGGFFCCRLG
jgi:hypothetical protein